MRPPPQPEMCGDALAYSSVFCRFGLSDRVFLLISYQYFLNHLYRIDPALVHTQFKMNSSIFIQHDEKKTLKIDDAKSSKLFFVIQDSVE